MEKSKETLKEFVQMVTDDQKKLDLIFKHLEPVISTEMVQKLRPGLSLADIIIAENDYVYENRTSDPEYMKAAQEMKKYKIFICKNQRIAIPPEHALAVLKMLSS
jgi:hypothetical protein